MGIFIHVKEIQQQYQGYFLTPQLWTGELEGITQFDFQPKTNSPFNLDVSDGIRLGHLVEHFVYFDFSHTPNIEVLAKNVQLNNERTTLGEIDFIIQRDGEIFHIETSYKFYLFDPDVHRKGIYQWVGPNRRDSFDRKLEKIKRTQFPLLKTEEAEQFLLANGIATENLKQRAYFKAQLFVPFGRQIDVAPLNPDAVAGEYIRFEHLLHFKTSKFHFPTKYNWLAEPRVNVDWTTHSKALSFFQSEMGNQQSVMFWAKNENGNIKKYFLVWW